MWPFKDKSNESKSDSDSEEYWLSRACAFQKQNQPELDALAEEFPVGSVHEWLGRELVVTGIGERVGERPSGLFYGGYMPPMYKVPAVWFAYRNEAGEEDSILFRPPKLAVLRANKQWKKAASQ